jgi:hypothetical protein
VPAQLAVQWGTMSLHHITAQCEQASAWAHRASLSVILVGLRLRSSYWGVREAGGIREAGRARAPVLQANAQTSVGPNKGYKRDVGQVGAEAGQIDGWCGNRGDWKGSHARVAML